MQPGELRSFGQRLRALRLGLELSQAELARRIGRHQTAIGPYERDEYMPSRDVVEKLAGALETSPEYLQFGRSPHRSNLPRLGRLSAAGQLVQADRMPTLALAEERLVAVSVDDDAMLPVFRPGQLVLVTRAATLQLEPLIGRHVIAELTDGRQFLRRLLPAAETGGYVLAAYQAPPLGPLRPVAARLVVGQLEPEALSSAAQENNPYG
jgi:transcriptional regulator with XRE-family HTH domain